MRIATKDCPARIDEIIHARARWVKADANVGEDYSDTVERWEEEYPHLAAELKSLV